MEPADPKKTARIPDGQMPGHILYVFRCEKCGSELDIGGRCSKCNPEKRGLWAALTKERRPPFAAPLPPKPKGNGVLGTLKEVQWKNIPSALPHLPGLFREVSKEVKYGAEARREWGDRQREIREKQAATERAEEERKRRERPLSEQVEEGIVNAIFKILTWIAVIWLVYKALVALGIVGS